MSMVAAALAVLAGPAWTASAPAPESIVELTRHDRAPKIDGVLDQQEWAGATRLELGYQTQPGDNVPPSEPTEVYLACDDRHLYLAFRSLDSDAAAIRGRVARREEIFQDDYVAVYLDTFNDRRRAYVFWFNPLGIQADGLYNEGTATGKDWDDNVDKSWDGVLSSKGTVTSDGYVVEAAIPFDTLRYQVGQPWGLHVRRWIARKAEDVHWRPVPREASSLLLQMGTLAGLPRLEARRSLEVIPAVLASVTGERQEDARLTDQADADPGVTAAWSLTPNLTFSGTLNPDFSQIEADVPQVDVNQRFPLFFPEKRPFFLEGDQFFRSPGALTFVDTRQIVDPDCGGKLTGKLGRNSLGLLAAADAAPGRVAGPGDPGEGRDAFVGIGRYQRDLFVNSTLGGFVAERRFAGSSNTLVALDGQLRLPGHVVGWQLGRSWTTDPASSSVEGSATYLWYELPRRHWRIFLNDLRLSPDYRALTGFVRRTGIRSNSANIGYEFQSDGGSWFVKIRPFVAARYLRTTEGLLDESYVDPGADVTLPRDIKLYVYHSFHRDAFAGREHDYQFNVVDWSANAFKKVSLEGRLQIGEGVNFDPANAVVGSALDNRLQITLKPDARFNSQWLWLRSTLAEKDSGRRLFRQDIFRNRTSCQITRDHAVRVTAQYDTRSRRVELSGLYSFTPRPNTALYLGYGDVLLNDYDPVAQRRDEGLFRLRRTFFIKLSQGFRP